MTFGANFHSILGPDSTFNDRQDATANLVIIYLLRRGTLRAQLRSVAVSGNSEEGHGSSREREL